MDDVDLESIAARERVTRHDVKARIEEFNALAGHEHIHKGMTSRDLTENVEQLQIRSSLVLVRDRMRGRRWRGWRTWPSQYSDLACRPSPQRRRADHHAGQALRHGRRRAARRASTGWRTCSSDTRCAASRARSAPSRTCSTCSAVTQQAWPSWSSGSPSTSASPSAHSVGSGLSPLAGPRRGLRAGPGGGRPVDLATTIRLMAGQRAGDRGIRPGQVGSSAMPHKMNARSCERVNGFTRAPARLRGHGRRAGRRPVERGRRVLLGGPPGRPAGRLLRHRRPVRDLPDGAGRVRRLPRGHRVASWTGTCRSWPRPRC